ncbi:MAG: BON domain-containing protein [Methylococcales bacterium]|nr:BON domain-containing protein [Methylococcales bacterium]
MKLFTRLMSASLMALILLAGAGCASTKSHEGTGEYMDDSLVTSKVKAAILSDPALSSAEINVETFKGVVQLSGFVNSKADISRAVAVARTVSGVTSVKNDMRLK